MKTISVDLADRSYEIRIGRDLSGSFGEMVKTLDLPPHTVIVTDKNVARLYLRPIANSLRHAGCSVDFIVIMPGEQQKTLQRAYAIATKLLDVGASRRTTLVALGGGVVGDLTGFVAANFRRGVPLVQYPTTLLSQTDSSIGGKVAVNHPRGKNAIGTFYQPKLVSSDVALIHSLPRPEVISGLGEIVKYGIISGGVMFEFLRDNIGKILVKDLDVIEEAVLRCARMKASLVSADERETEKNGGRAVLNIGHAVGQALEELSQYTLRHGEAVLLGLRMETMIAVELGILSAADGNAIYDYLSLIPFEYTATSRRGGRTLFSRDRLLRLLANRAFVLPAGIGKIEFRTQIPESVLKKAVTALVP
jgi:3-dehydroquinate synthase